MVNTNIERLSNFARHAFSVALTLGIDIEPVMWMYIGQYQGKYIFRHKVTGRKVRV